MLYNRKEKRRKEKQPLKQNKDSKGLEKRTLNLIEKQSLQCNLYNWNNLACLSKDLNMTIEQFVKHGCSSKDTC